MISKSARVNFYEIQEVESTYNAPAVYYYSHIHYADENYETALWDSGRSIMIHFFQV